MRIWRSSSTSSAKSLIACAGPIALIAGTISNRDYDVERMNSSACRGACILVAARRCVRAADKAARDEQARAALRGWPRRRTTRAISRRYDSFSESFTLSHEPALLYNIASALQGLKRPHDAAEALRSYCGSRRTIRIARRSSSAFARSKRSSASSSSSASRRRRRRGRRPSPSRRRSRRHRRAARRR